MTQQQRTIVMSLFVIAVLATAAWLFATVMAHAGCHKYSVWNYPYPQRCSIRYVQKDFPFPPFKEIEQEPETPPVDIPLPSLENMEFPPDCLADWCQRLKGIGLLREKFGTN